MTIALIDADILAWRSSASCEPNKEKLEREPLDLAISRLDEWVYRILLETSAEKYRLFLSGPENFRNIIYPLYKANRRGLPRPDWLEPCREFLVREWRAEITVGYEADDALGIHANEDTVICTIDKDLRQVPGIHYNFVSRSFDVVDSQEAELSFWCSLLQGDRSDNIRGIDGVGPVKAKRALSSLPSEEMESAVRRYYEGREREFDVNYHLLKILRSEDEYRGVLEKIDQGFFEKSESSESSEASSCEDSGTLS